MSAAFGTETVLDVRHWTDGYFSFTTTRDAAFRFDNGQFVMLGLPWPQAEGGARPLLRAYSIASANWEEQLEFFSIHVPDGALTSSLLDLQPSDPVLIGRKPTGTLLIHDLHPGRNLNLLGTGTGDAQLPCHPLLGDLLRERLLYYRAATREDCVHGERRHRGRLTDLMASRQMMRDLGFAPLDARLDRAMLCASPQMLADFHMLLEGRGFEAAPRIGVPGQYVFERAFVEK